MMLFTRIRQLPYRTRRMLRRIAIVTAILLAVLLLVWGCWMIFLNGNISKTWGCGLGRNLFFNLQLRYLWGFIV